MSEPNYRMAAEAPIALGYVRPSDVLSAGEIHQAYPGGYPPPIRRRHPRGIEKRCSKGGVAGGSDAEKIDAQFDCRLLLRSNRLRSSRGGRGGRGGKALSALHSCIIAEYASAGSVKIQRFQVVTEGGPQVIAAESIFDGGL